MDEFEEWCGGEFVEEDGKKKCKVRDMVVEIGGEDKNCSVEVFSDDFTITDKESLIFDGVTEGNVEIS